MSCQVSLVSSKQVSYAYCSLIGEVWEPKADYRGWHSTGQELPSKVKERIGWTQDGNEVMSNDQGFYSLIFFVV
jgi:hypothetical protein